MTVAEPVDVDLDLIAKGLAGRMAEIAAAVDRYGAFAFRPDPVEETVPPPVSAPAGGDLATARDLVRRALAVLADPVNGRIARILLDGDATLSELSRSVVLPRLAVWERVHDLVQVGLVGHELDGDRAGLTAAGQGLAALVERLASGVAREVAP